MKNISIIFLLFSLIVHDTHARIHWPEGKKAAVILTYDDGLKSQLQIVIPQLEKHNFRGTFFLYGQVIKEEDIPEWRKASQRGHELGNHSMFHPCLSQTTGQTTKPCHSLECYSVKDMLIEIGMMNNFLYAIDGKKEHAYAYPCSQCVAGGEDYSKPLLASGLSRFARGGDRGIITNTDSLNYAMIPTLPAHTGISADSLIAYVQEAVEKGGLAIIVFHGVGGDYLTVDADEHKKLLDFLASRPDIWVGTFSEVLNAITTGKNTQKEQSTVRIDTNGDFITYVSPYYALSWSKNFPMMSYWNIESGGRNRKYLDKSLLRPGKGGVLINRDNSSFLTQNPAIYKGMETCYENVTFPDKTVMNCSVIPTNERQFSITIGGSGNKFCHEFFRIHTAPDIAPMSVWAEKTENKPSTLYDTPVTIYTPQIVKASFRLPAILHFPDYGLVKIEADQDEVYIQEHFVPDYENTGLSLGPFNRGGHAWRKSVHLGSVILSFHSEKPINKACLTFTVLDENYPQIAGCDFADPRFNGLKRCWQNSFTVNPVHQTMGDNIILEGIGHLSLAFKADMIPFTPELPGTYSMRAALRTSIEIALQERIGENNRIKDFGWECTETTLISLHKYLLATNDWDFIRHYLPQINRLVKGVLDADTDHDGIFEAPFHGNQFEEGRSSWNWWDDFAFGHKDTYLNILAYKALNGMHQIYTLLNMKTEADSVRTRLDLFHSAFNHTFYNKETGMYAGWISQDGKIHDYQFSFVNSMAINEGLVEKERSKRIIKKLLKNMKEAGYDFVYGVPGPTVPVSKEDKGKWDEMTRWGRYENGGLCGQTAYHFIQALYNTGMKEQADEILFKMMDTYEREYTHSGLFPGYLQSVDWRTKGGAPTGYNYLADNYYFLLAAITGYYGIKYPELKSPGNR